MAAPFNGPKMGWLDRIVNVNWGNNFTIGVVELFFNFSPGILTEVHNRVFDSFLVPHVPADLIGEGAEFSKSYPSSQAVLVDFPPTPLMMKTFTMWSSPSYFASSDEMHMIWFFNLTEAFKTASHWETRLELRQPREAGEIIDLVGVVGFNSVWQGGEFRIEQPGPGINKVVKSTGKVLVEQAQIGWDLGKGFVNDVPKDFFLDVDYDAPNRATMIAQAI